jgi:hypothetical protein
MASSRAVLPMPAGPLRERRRGLLFRHLGTSGSSLRGVAETLSDGRILAPRTGHLADWADIVSGRSTVLDYNDVICKVLRVGRPLLYDFTQTETTAMDRGDTLFLPGSLVEGGIRTPLPTFHWRDGAFHPHDRGSPLFLPYVETAHEGTRLPLTRLHRLRNSERVPLPVDHHSALCLRNEQRVRELLLALVGGAVDDRALGQVLDRVVHRNGHLEQAPVSQSGSGFRAGDAYYPTAESLVDAVDVRRRGPWARPVVFLMAPAAPYLLWVPETRHQDRDLVALLLHRVTRAIAAWPDRMDRCTPVVGQVVEQWATEEGRAVSTAFRRQFGWADRTSPAGVELPAADLVEPAGFSELTMAQACLVVGAVVKVLGGEQP